MAIYPDPNQAVFINMPRAESGDELRDRLFRRSLRDMAEQEARQHAAEQQTDEEGKTDEGT